MLTATSTFASHAPRGVRLSAASKASSNNARVCRRNTPLCRRGVRCGALSSDRNSTPCVDKDVETSSKPARGLSLSRRGVLSQGSAAVLAGIVSSQAQLAMPSPASAAEVNDSKMVGAYLPEAEGLPGYNVFTAGATRTPALRRGRRESNIEATSRDRHPPRACSLNTPDRAVASRVFNSSLINHHANKKSTV